MTEEMTFAIGAVLKPRLSNVILSLLSFFMTAKADHTPSQIRDAMLNWYDKHARALPWRAKYGVRPDPYHAWLSEVMLQQTTVRAVIPYFEKFITIWPSINGLANAKQEDVLREWAGLGYYSRARNLHKCAVTIVRDYDGRFPENQKDLKSLPGIGDYTSAAILSIAFDHPATVIDGNVERVISRLYRIKRPLPESKPIIKTYALPLFEGDNKNRPSCFAQAMMDLGATVCTPKSPQCGVCPVSKYCEAYMVGDPAKYPWKAKKTKLPEKHAVASIYLSNGKVGIETRPETGMLGGMVGFPTGEWVSISKNLPGNFDKKRKIRHVFTHFALTLYPEIITGKTDNMIPINDIETIGLPTLFKKLWNVVKSEL